MTALVERMRFPVALTLGLLMTATLFALLGALTSRNFEVIPTTTVKPEFSRIERETPTKTRREPKVVRDPPPKVVVISDFIDTTDPDVTSIPIARTDPVLDIPTGIAVSGADRDAVPLVRINPTYPPRAAANNIEGWVRVQFDIAASGGVTNVVAVESEPGTVFDAAAVDAVARWRYNPSIVEGRPVERVGMQTLIRFTLEDAE